MTPESRKATDVIAVIDDDLILENAEDLFNGKILLEKDGQFKPSKGLIANLFPDPLAKYLYTRRELYESINAPVDIGDIQALQHSKVNLYLLIDSPGGMAMISDLYERLIAMVKNNGGRVDAYLGLRAFSAAQVLACLANERTCLQKSRIMIHQPSCLMELSDWQVATGLGERVRQLIDETRARSLALLRAAASPSCREELETKVRKSEQDSSNADQSSYFLGSDLKRMGIVTECFSDTDGMIEKFEEKTGIRFPAVESGHPISEFFSNQKRKPEHPGPRAVTPQNSP